MAGILRHSARAIILTTICTRNDPRLRLSCRYLPPILKSQSLHLLQHTRTKVADYQTMEYPLIDWLLMVIINIFWNCPKNNNLSSGIPLSLIHLDWIPSRTSVFNSVSTLIYHLYTLYDVVIWPFSTWNHFRSKSLDKKYALLHYNHWWSFPQGCHKEENMTIKILSKARAC